MGYDFIRSSSAGTLSDRLGANGILNICSYSMNERLVTPYYRYASPFFAIKTYVVRYSRTYYVQYPRGMLIRKWTIGMFQARKQTLSYYSTVRAAPDSLPFTECSRQDIVNKQFSKQPVQSRQHPRLRTTFIQESMRIVKG